MPVITYVAVDRGFLVGGHTAGVEYQIECDLQAFPPDLEFKGQKDETLDGTPESYMDALQLSWNVKTDLVLAADVAKWREFFTSVMNSEIFQMDFTGTIAEPGTEYDVHLTTTKITPQQLRGGHERYSFTVKRAP